MFSPCLQYVGSKICFLNTANIHCFGGWEVEVWQLVPPAVCSTMVSISVLEVVQWRQANQIRKLTWEHTHTHTRFMNYDDE